MEPNQVESGEPRRVMSQGGLRGIMGSHWGSMGVKDVTW